MCGFDFRQFYQGFDKDYAEVHHLNPLSSTENERETTLDDLAIVCSNCHSAIHRIDPMPSLAEMKNMVRANKTLE